MEYTIVASHLLFVLAVVVHGRPTGGDDELVMVKELGDSRLRRSAKTHLPSHLHTNFRIGGDVMSLRLERNTAIGTNIPFTFVKNKREKIYIPDREDIALYQDDTQGAAISVTSRKSQNGQHHHVLEGSFNFNDSHYVIHPIDSISPGSSYDRFDGVPHLIKKVQLPEGYQTMAKKHYEEFKRNHNHTMLQRSTSKDRRKRSTVVASYHVELMFILDHTIYDYWLSRSSDRNDALSKIKYYYLHVMNGMDLAYKSINTSMWEFTITPFLTEYHIAETAAESDWTETSILQSAPTVEETIVNATAILDKMSVWKTQDGRSWKNPDHAMLWTRYDIFGSALATVGYAFTMGICVGGAAVSVIQESGLYSWAIAAHELGHSLGAHHDGVGNSCTASDMFLMTATIGSINDENRANAFTFSPCALLAFKELLSGTTDGFPRVCLTDRVCSHGVSTQGHEILPGVTYSLDEQCVLHYGEHYTHYYYGGDTNETICYTMHCVDPTQMLLYTLKRGATVGTPCDVDKCCHKGECVADCSYSISPSSPCTATNLTSDVPHGCTDSGELFKVNGVNITCADLVTKHASLCFTWDLARDRLCCETCHRAGAIAQTQHLVTPDSTPTSAPSSGTTKAVSAATTTTATMTAHPTIITTATTTTIAATTTTTMTPDYVKSSTGNPINTASSTNTTLPKTAAVTQRITTTAKTATTTKGTSMAQRTASTCRLLIFITIIALLTT